MAFLISIHDRTGAQPSVLTRRLVWALLAAATIANMIGIAGRAWDAAYHARYLVDTFFSPPHLLIYGAMAGMALLGLIVLGTLAIDGRAQGDWLGVLARRSPLVLMLLANLGFPATGSLDDLWHRSFGRDQLTAWTPPHAILVLNLAATALAIVGLALWLGADRPAGDLAPAPPRTSHRVVDIMLFVGISMAVAHLWSFALEWEHVQLFSNPVVETGWLYPPLAVLDAALCLSLAERLLPKRWWMTPLTLVLAAQLWWVVPAALLIPFGYTGGDTFSLPLTLAGLSYVLIGWAGGDWRPWMRYAAFGASSIAVVVVALAAGNLPNVTLAGALLTTPLLPILAIAGGFAGDGLAGWLQQLAERPPSAHDRGAEDRAPTA